MSWRCLRSYGVSGGYSGKRILSKLLKTYKVVKFKDVFNGSVDLQTDAEIARLCVLFEDLRIEIYGMRRANESAGECFDVAGNKSRQLYFLRRSLLSIKEFGDAVSYLNRQEKFRTWVNRLSGGPNDWDQAVDYFKKEQCDYWTTVRNGVGGHFGHAAALYAVENSAADAVGGVQVTTNSDGAHRLVLMFSAEIAATPLLQHTTGTNNEEKIKALTEDALLAYRFSTQAVEFLVMNYIWPRAGTGQSCNIINLFRRLSWSPL